MRKLLLSVITLAVVMATAGGYDRTVSATFTNGARVLNSRQHATATVTPRVLHAPRAAADAPENVVEVPFEHDMGKSGKEIKNYTAINVNNDNRKWQYGAVNGYSACMPPNADNVDENDDWLITVPIHLLPGNYVLSFEVGIMGSGATGVRMEVFIGKEPTVEGMMAEVVKSTTYTEKNLTAYQYPCAIPEEGYYYVGFHCTTPKSMKGTLKLAKVGMKAGEVVAPADPPAAGTLTWELAPKGELKATVTYTAPTKTKSGADLEAISKVVITSRWEVDKFEYTDVAPGQVIVVENVEMYAGFNNRFTGVAYVGDTPGDKVEHKNIFCGPDSPLPPTNVKLTPSADFSKATLSWDPVGSVGENGGYVDVENVTYYIFDAFGSYYDPAIAEVTGTTSYQLSFPDLEGQDFVAYQVTAGNGDYYSTETSSNIITIGKPAKMPFAESFADGRYDGLWLIDPATSGMQQYGTVDDGYFASLIDPDDPEAPKPLTSQDGDNGFYYWMPVDKDAMLGLQSVRVDLSDAVNPVFDIWYQGQGSMLDILIASADGELAPAHTIDLQKAPTSGWTLCRLPLAQYKDAGAISFEVRLRAVHNDDDHIWSVPFDHISIHDLFEKDLRMAALSAPSTVKATEKLLLTARVENTGETSAESASISWRINDKVIGTSPLETLAPNEFATATFEYTVPANAPEELNISAQIEFTGDGYIANDMAATTVTVKFNNFPTVADLTATPTDGRKVELKWSAPQLDNLPGPETVTEDFENPGYTPMAINGAGAWTVFDGDGGYTYNVFRELVNPYQTQPIGFQLYNRVAAQVPDMYWLDAEPHSGNTFMMAPSCEGPNDNWLISPTLSGNAQTVTFWAKSCMAAWPESFEVLYSTTDNSIAAFTAKVEVGNYPADNAVPEVWTEFTATLPEGARHFAIHHNPDNTLALLVDDVTYEAAPEIPSDLAVKGYLIFRDSANLTEAPVSETTYTDDPLTDGTPDGNYTFTYNVAPVYNHGVAKISNEALANLQYVGIETIDLHVADTANTRYYNLQGIRVETDNLTPGIYVAVGETEVRKVILR